MREAEALEEIASHLEKLTAEVSNLAVIKDYLSEDSLCNARQEFADTAGFERPYKPMP